MLNTVYVDADPQAVIQRRLAAPEIGRLFISASLTR
jgi:hypothetical protein